MKAIVVRRSAQLRYGKDGVLPTATSRLDIYKSTVEIIPAMEAKPATAKEPPPEMPKQELAIQRAPWWRRLFRFIFARRANRA